MLRGDVLLYKIKLGRNYWSNEVYCKMQNEFSIIILESLMFYILQVYYSINWIIIIIYY